MTKKIDIDTTQAVASIRKLAKAMSQLDTKIGTYNTRTTDLNRISKSTITRFETLNPHITQTSRILGPMNRRMAKTSQWFRDLNASTRLANNELNRVSIASNNVVTSFGVAISSLRKMSNTLGKVNRQLERERTTISSIVKSLKMFDTAMKRVVSTMHDKNTALGFQARQTKLDEVAMRRNMSAMSGWGRSMRRVRDIIFSFAGYGAIIQLTNQIVEATRASKDWSQSISEIRTISDRTAKSTKEWTKETISLSNAFGSDFVEVAEAGYQALSNQITEAGTSTKFLAEEAILGATAIATLDESVQATTGILNAYEQSAGGAARVNAILFKTVEEGRLRLNEIANSTGRVSILSKQLNISLVEQNASIALLTRLGLKADEALTAIRNVQLRLIKPTERMKNELRGMGFSSGQAAVQALGFVGVMDRFLKIASQSGDITAELGDLFGRLRGIVGATGLSGEFGRLEQTIEKFSTASSDYIDAFLERQQSLAFRSDQQFQRFRNSLVNNIGTPILEFLVETTEGFGGAEQVVNSTISTLRDLVTAYVGYQVAVFSATTATRSYTVAIHLLGGSLTATQAAQARTTLAMLAARGPYVAAAAAIGSLIYVTSRLANTNNDLSRMVDQTSNDYINNMMSNVEATRALRLEFDKLMLSVEQTQQNTDRQLGSLFANLTLANTNFADQVQNTWEALGKAMEATTDRLSSKLKTSINALSKQRSDIESSIGSRKDVLFRQRQQVKFDERLLKVQGNPEQQIEKLVELRAKIRVEAEQAIKQGDSRLYDTLIKQLDKLFQMQKQRIEKLRQFNEEMVNTGRKRIVQNFDPIRGFSLRTQNVKEQRNSVKARQLSQDLLDLEKQRLNSVNLRIAAEEKFIAKQEQRAEKLKIQETIQAEALKNFKDVLASIDSFSIKGSSLKEFKSLISSAEKFGKTAGLGGRDLVGLLRQANAKSKTLENQIFAADQKNRIELVKKLQAEQSKFSNKLKNSISEAFSSNQGAAVQLATEVKEEFDAIRFTSERVVDSFGKGLRTNRIMQSLVTTPKGMERLKKEEFQIERVIVRWQDYLTQLDQANRLLAATQGAKSFEQQQMFVKDLSDLVTGLSEELQTSNLGALVEEMTEGFKQEIGEGQLLEGLSEFAQGVEAMKDSFQTSIQAQKDFSAITERTKLLLKDFPDQMKRIQDLETQPFERPINSVKEFNEELFKMEQLLNKTLTKPQQARVPINGRVQQQTVNVTIQGMDFNLEAGSDPQKQAEQIVEHLRRELRRDDALLRRGN